MICKEVVENLSWIDCFLLWSYYLFKLLDAQSCGTRLDHHKLHWICQQEWMATKLAWPQSTGLSCLGDVLEPKVKNLNELMDILQSVWDELPEDSIIRAVLSLSKFLLHANHSWFLVTLHFRKIKNWLLVSLLRTWFVVHVNLLC